MMIEYTSKDELLNAWINDAASEMVIAGSQPNRDDALAIARIMVRTLAVYVPHLYRGGWVIRGFGYSVERIGKYISQEVAGNPALV